MDTTQSSEPYRGPESLDAETKEILDGMEKEGFSVERPDKPSPAQPEQKPAEKPKEKPDDQPKPEDEKPTPKEEKAEKPKEEGVKPDSKKQESWRDAIARKRQAQRNEELETLKKEKEQLAKENEELKKGKHPDPNSNKAGDEKDGKSSFQLNEQQKKVAAKYGIDEEDAKILFSPQSTTQEKVVVKEALTPEQAAALKQFTEHTQQVQLESSFRNDFEENVLPLIKAEYPSISDAKIKEIREKILNKITTQDEYATTPLQTIYKGEDEFRGLVNTPKKSAEDSQHVTVHQQKAYDFDNVTDDDISAMDEATFNEYSTYQERREKGKR